MIPGRSEAGMGSVRPYPARAVRLRTATYGAGRRAAAAMRRQADTRTDLDAPETPLSGDIAACSLAVTYAERHDRTSDRCRYTSPSSYLDWGPTAGNSWTPRSRTTNFPNPQTRLVAMRHARLPTYACRGGLCLHRGYPAGPLAVASRHLRALPGAVQAVAATSAAAGQAQFIFATDDGHLWHTSHNDDETLDGAGGTQTP